MSDEDEAPWPLHFPPGPGPLEREGIVGLLKFRALSVLPPFLSFHADRLTRRSRAGRAR